jgi:hypothetical protein
MKLLAFVSILLPLGLTNSPAIAEIQSPPSLFPDDFFYGKAPPASDWIRFVPLMMASTVSNPVFYFSPTKFNPDFPQVLFYLPDTRYRSFVKYTRTNRCAFHSGDRLLPQVLEVKERSKSGPDTRCTMSLIQACRYLAGMKPFHINGADQNWQLLERFRITLGCK